MLCVSLLVRAPNQVLGANQDAFAEGGKIGIERQATMHYEANANGTAAAFRSISAGSASFRKKARVARQHAAVMEDQGEAERFMKSTMAAASASYFEEA